MTSTAPTRFYVVAATDSGHERLIRARNRGRAVTLATVARIATQADLERLFALGVIPEAPEGVDPLSEGIAVRKRGPKGKHRPRKSRAKAQPSTTTTSRSTSNV